MLHAEFDDLADIFHGPGVAANSGLPTSLTLRAIHAFPRSTRHGVAPAGGQSQHGCHGTPCDSCDSCDSQASVRAGGPIPGLRHAATFATPAAPADRVSQKVAGSRREQNTPQSRANPQESQKSQVSQGFPSVRAATSANPPRTAPGKLPATTAPEAWPAPAWSDADIARFKARRDRLIRWGNTAADAQELADRLTRRDLTDDDRVSCVDCGQYRPGRCGNHRAARLNTNEVGHDLAALLQRCPGFTPCTSGRP